MADDLNDSAKMDATAQAELVRSGAVSPRELVDTAIERVEKLNPHLNAVIRPRYEKARAEQTHLICLTVRSREFPFCSKTYSVCMPAMKSIVAVRR